MSKMPKSRPCPICSAQKPKRKGILNGKHVEGSLRNHTESGIIYVCNNKECRCEIFIPDTIALKDKTTYFIPEEE